MVAVNVFVVVHCIEIAVVHCNVMVHCINTSSFKCGVVAERLVGGELFFFVWSSLVITLDHAFIA